MTLRLESELLAPRPTSSSPPPSPRYKLDIGLYHESFSRLLWPLRPSGARSVPSCVHLTPLRRADPACLALTGSKLRVDLQRRLVYNLREHGVIEDVKENEGLHVEGGGHSSIEKGSDPNEKQVSACSSHKKGRGRIHLASSLDSQTWRACPCPPPPVGS